jgi:hypothetical protein
LRVVSLGEEREREGGGGVRTNVGLKGRRMGEEEAEGKAEGEEEKEKAEGTAAKKGGS